MLWRRAHESPSVRLHGRSAACAGGLLEGNTSQRAGNGDGDRPAGELGLPDGAGVRSFAPTRVSGRERTSAHAAARYSIGAAGNGVGPVRRDGAGVGRKHALRRRGRDAAATPASVKNVVD